jgi:hypothetical protein
VFFRLARDAQPFAPEAKLDGERKGEGQPTVAKGRLEELKHLEAGERALAAAYVEHAHGAEAVARFLRLGERHRQHAAILAERIVALGGAPKAEPDDYWILGDIADEATLIEAEQNALHAYHDHLLDFDPETMQLIRDRIIHEHENALDELTEEPPFTLDFLEHA